MQYLEVSGAVRHIYIYIYIYIIRRLKVKVTNCSREFPAITFRAQAAISIRIVGAIIKDSKMFDF